VSTLRRLLLVTLFLFPALALAETEVIEVYHLPLSEAASAVQSQLSPQGEVRTMPSRRMLIITDDAAHIGAAKALLKRLDKVPAQYRVEVELVDVSDSRNSAIGVQQLRLPGGWIELRLAHSAMHISERRRMQLRVTSMQPGHIEAGELRPYRQRIWQWLAGYGVVAADTVELVPVTSGFDVEVAGAGNDAVRVQLKPWMRRMAGDAADAPIMIVGARTEVTVSLGETVTIAANEGESALFSRALLGSESTSGSGRLAIRLRVNAAGGR